MKWEYILEVPFESKGYFYDKKNAKYKYKGKNYFLLDKNGFVLRDFMLLEDKLTYRENDNNMMIGSSGEGTKFWQKSFGPYSVGELRRKTLSFSPINSHIANGDLALIDNLNDISISYANTSLTLDGFITGSNSSGADSKLSAAPLICTDESYYGMRHINPFKKLRVITNNKNAYKKYEINIEILKKTNKLDLENYFVLFPKNKKVFYKYNPESKYLLYNKDDDVTETLYYINYTKSEMEKEITSYNELMITLFDKYKNNEINKFNLANKLRGLLRPSLLLEKRIIDEPIVIGFEEKESNLDAAHLMEVNDLKNHNVKDWWMMGDKDNGLLLPKDLHWKFDKDEEFVLNDNFVFEKKGIETEFKINPKYINENRIKYLKYRYQKEFIK